ncbi:hypothetical protein [Streptomyces sp. NPDC058045]|uniref:hypothetical protein n=1 Tax=Streptomyces sp. NPDC058045 TaxID=3346311 RepID=UPI0036E73D76
MSRETDSSSSGPQGRGGTAYPSGTPPYGSQGAGAAADEGTDTGRQADSAPSPERKTETTLTTRIRINIPGSRPIPPVVMRTPMSDVNEGAADAGGQGGPGAEPQAPAAEPEAPQAPAPERTSDWFAPRKSAGQTRTGTGGPTADTGATPALGTGLGTGPDGTPAARPLDATPPVGTPSPFVTPGPMGASATPTDTGSNPVLDNARAEHPDATSSLYRDGSGTPGAPESTGSFRRPGDTGGVDVSAAVAAGPLGAPSGPTTGPAPGDGAFAPGRGPGGITASDLPGAPGGPRRTSDDTAILTPQQPAPETGGSRDNISGSTLTSGIPPVPASGGPRTPGGPGEPSARHTPPQLPDPPERDNRSGDAAPKKKGRNKPALIGAGVIVLAGLAYGAGLLVNHSDVPKGTTVLGVDIGGGTRDDATKKLDAALGARTTQALKLSVDGDEVSLSPDQSGLALDTEATVADAAGSDYNPVTVIGSLFGGTRAVEPVMPVDEEKLHAALERAAGGAGSATEGSVRFVPGKAVPVYGKAGKGIDVAGSTKAVEKAYRTQVETGRAAPAQLPVTTRQPTVPKAEVDRMMKEFARPAMSGIVTVKAGSASIPFGPEKSLPKILGVQPIDGKLVDTYDKQALKELYGNTFDGVLITRATGKKTPVQPEDVISAMRKALLGKTPAQRTATIETNPN